MTKAKIELPPKLIPVFTGKARYRGAFGGRGSGKTVSFAKMSAVRGYQWAMEGKTGQILCGREFQNSLEESSFIEVKDAIMSVDWLRDFYEIGANFIRTKCGKVKYTFTGLRHNLDSVKSKGRILLAWVDEAENVSGLAWSKLIPTVREDDSEVWVTWNPESDESDTHMRFRADPPENSKIVELNYTDNPWWNNVLEQERLEDKEKRPDTYKWIWEGDFNVNSVGAVYGKQLLDAKERITEVPYEDGVPVFTGWDLGKNDATSIWFAQIVGFQLRVIDYYEASGEDLAHYAKLIRSKPYEYSNHYLPHDGKHERLGMEGSIKDQLTGMGLKCKTLPISSIASGIEEGRKLIKTGWFDKKSTKDGIKALKGYRYVYDEKRKTFSTTPLHDWASHGADGWRSLANAYKLELNNEEETVDVKVKVPNGSGGWMY